MSDDLDPFVVTISRSGEGAHQDPEVTMGATTLSNDERGVLAIKSKTGGRLFGTGT